MPRIDPLQLLKCLSVLLSQEGGILSRDEVPRLVNLMTKFSKKLVSKCVYVLILKNTETSLVDMFMAEGGWTLIQTWLQDAAQSGNWVLVKEILGLLLITPVDVERLKLNCLPKLIKNLSRREEIDGVAGLSNQIVQNWLVIVKGSAQNTASVPPVQTQLEKRKHDSDSVGIIMKKIEDLNPQTNNELLPKPGQNEINEDSNFRGNFTENDQAINTSIFYKATAEESKESGKKSDYESSSVSINNMEEEPRNEIKDDKIFDSKLNDKDKKKSSKSSTYSRSKSSSSSSRDKNRDKDRKRSSRSTSSKSKSSSSGDKDQDRNDKDRERKDKDRIRHSSSSKSSSNKSSSKDKKESGQKSKSSNFKDTKDSKGTKEKQAEMDKDTLQKLKPQTLDKIGRIPKKSSSDEKQKENKTDKSKENPENDSTKKPSFSILHRKVSGEERTKTVKVFNSKMRSTGLEEEVKPPPPRSVKKPSPSMQLPTIPPKRPSPTRELSSLPPEKKLKIDRIDLPERPGAIKLIPPKPKPPVLQESDMFMDALTASAPKKEAKKRKRRLSITKDAPTSPTSSPAGGDPSTPTSPTLTSQSSTTLGLKNIAPINFYQDTLSEETKTAEENKIDDSSEENENIAKNINLPETNDTPVSPTPSNNPKPFLDNEAELTTSKIMKTDGLKGVLLYAKKKGPKRSIKWKADEELVDIRYFELDETERVNVTKTFGDMAKMDISSEREALILSRKPANDDFMEPQTIWRMLYICEQPDHLAAPGSKSLEKDIQFAREKSVLPAIYFDKRRIPDSAEEPIPENHQMSDPVIIPLEDPDSQEIDLKSTPWPEPKGSPPQMEPQPTPPIFLNMPFNPNFNNMGNIPPGAQFVGIPPRFPGPTGPLGPIGPVPGSYGPSNMMPNNMIVPPMNHQEIINQGPIINPVMYGPGPDAYMGPGNEPNFPVHQFNGPPGPNMNMFGPNNFNRRGGGVGDNEGRGGYRRGGGNNGGWVRMNGPRNNWKRGRGAGLRGGRLCKNIQNHGYCRNGDNCPFVH